MSNVLLCFPNRIDQATLSGGAWESSLPRSNLQNRTLGKVARTSSDATSATQFDIDLGASRFIRCLSLINHNASLDALVRIRGSASPHFYEPSMVADFATNKALGPLITFTRATSATYFGADGLLKTAVAGEARFDHDPVTLASKGLLIEEQRTNLLTYSEQFDNAAWGKARASITANAATAPDGTATADKLVEDTTASNTHQIASSNLVTVGTTYTFSVYVKAAERTRVRLYGSNSVANGGGGVIFDVSTGTVVSSDLVNNSATITHVGSDWYRCSCVFSGTAVAAQSAGIQLVSGSSQTYTGDGTSGLYIWGAQLEAGAFPTSYIPTTSAAATRNADIASMTGANFSSWYNQTEGTFVVSGSTGDFDTTHIPCLASADDGTTSERIQLRRANTFDQFNCVIVDGGVVQGILVSPASSWSDSAASHSAVSAYKSNDFSCAFDGVLGTVDASVTIPAPTQLQIGGGAGLNPLNGHIAYIAYYPERLSNAALQQLSADPRSVVATEYDSGWHDVWPTVYSFGDVAWGEINFWNGKYSDEERAGYTATYARLLTTAVQARYWRVEIDDTANPDGYIQIGRVFIGDGWQPAHNMSYGAGIGWEPTTDVQPAKSGAEYFDRRTPRRVVRFALEWLSHDEGMSKAFELFRRAGIDQEVFFAFDPADTVHAIRRQFLARLAELSPIDYPYVSTTSTAYQLKELL